MRRAEFFERAELLVMSALYIFGHGAHFRSLRALTHISTSEVRKFFFVFHDAFMDMQGEFIVLPENITELKRVTVSMKMLVFRVHVVPWMLSM